MCQEELNRMGWFERWSYKLSFMIFGKTIPNQVFVFLLLTVTVMNIITFVVYEDVWFDADMVTISVAILALVLTTIWCIGNLSLFLFYLWRLPYAIVLHDNDRNNDFFKHIFRKFDMQQLLTTKLEVFVFFSQLFIKKTLPPILAFLVSFIIYYDYYHVQTKMLEVLNIHNNGNLSPMETFKRQELIVSVFDEMNTFKDDQIVFIRDLDIFTNLQTAKQLRATGFKVEIPKDMKIVHCATIMSPTDFDKQKSSVDDKK